MVGEVYCTTLGFSQVENVKFVPAPRLVCIETNPGPPRRLSEKNRWKVIIYNEEFHLTPTGIARKLKTSRPTIYDTLQRLKKEWDNLSWTDIRKYVDSNKQRLIQCEECGGNRLDY